MDDAGRAGSNLAVGVNVRHYVVTHFLFALAGYVVVNVIDVRFQLVHLLLRDGQAEGHSALASDTHRRRQVENFMSEEKVYSISLDA